NWDVSLHERLLETGLAPLLDGAVASAEIGAAKPDPAIFAAALEIAGVGPAEACHVGDTPDADVAGALRAGVRPVLLVRDGATRGEFGQRRVAPRTALAWGAGLYAAFWVVAAIMLAIFGQPPEQDIVRELKHQDAVGVLAGYAVLTCVLAPIAEEFF